MQSIARPAARLWTPAALAVVFCLAFLVKLPGFVQGVWWNSDVASAGTLAEAFGHGGETFERYAYYPAFLFAVLTRWLPLHRELWEAAGYVAGLVSVVLLAAVSWRLAGLWAAAMTATIGLATSPFVSYERVTLNFHTPTFCMVVLLALFCGWLSRERSGRSAVVAALVVAVAAGVTLCDNLLLAVGIFPLAAAGALLALSAPSARLRMQGGLALATALAAVPVALLTDRLAAALDLHVFPTVALSFAPTNELWPNFGRLLYGIVQLVNGNYFLGSPLTVSSALSLGSAAAILLALAAPFALLVRERRSGSPRLELCVLACFWGACIVGTCVGFVLEAQENQGYGQLFYFTPILYAVAATVPVLFSATRPRRAIAALGVGVVALASIVMLFGSAALFYPRPAIAAVSSRIVAFARQEDALYGYAAYENVSSLRWASGGVLRLGPVWLTGGTVEPYSFGNQSSSWFLPRRSRSFLLGETGVPWPISSAPASLGTPIASETLAPGITMWVYPYDISTRFTYPATSPLLPDPSLRLGQGFYPTEQYQGSAVTWMRQDGRLVVSSDGFTALTIDATVQSNGRPRTLVLKDGDSVIARLEVPSGATTFQTKPLLLPAGATTLMLSATPGPTTLGPTDPRSASILFSGLDVEKQCAILDPASGQLRGCAD